MGRPALTAEQKAESLTARRAYRKNWMANRSVEKKTTDAEYRANWKATHAEDQQTYVEDYQDRTGHYWTCQKSNCPRCEAVAEWNKARIATGLSPCQDGKK